MIFSGMDAYEKLRNWTQGKNRILLVCDGFAAASQRFSRFFDSLEAPAELFTDFKPNPIYESVVEAVRLFREKKCDCIIAVGGGSAIDVAKCVKLYANAKGSGENGAFLKQEHNPAQIPFLAMPTTAGTGSEATRFAVIYFEGEKQSISDTGIIPDTVLFDPEVLRDLPDYQRKSTMLDALSHAIESYWSVNSTEESMEFSSAAIKEILANMEGYLANTGEGNEAMLKAAYTAGRAINITQTTAGHAMCYKITSIFGCAHGHTAMLCNRVLFPWMLKNTDKCTDPRGKKHLETVFKGIAMAMSCGTPEEAADKLNRIFDGLGLFVPEANAEQYEILRNSVNPVRLKNNPVPLDSESIDELYHRILR